MFRIKIIEPLIRKNHHTLGSINRKKEYLKKIKSTKTILFLIGFIGLVLVIAFDKFDKPYWANVLDEGVPDFSANYIIRSIIIFISTLAIFWAIIDKNKPKLKLYKSNELSLEHLSILGVLIVSVIFLLIFIFVPSIFSTLSREDNIIEWLSATLLFGSCFITAFLFLKSRNILNISKATQLSIAFLSLIFFVIAMEEVSWFQRVLKIETPKLFEGNKQNEMNLHNFYTTYVENMYYFGIFLFLVVFPFIRLFVPYISKNNYLKIFIARPFIGVIACIACAYNYDMWNVIFTQIAFFGSIVVLFAFATFSSSQNEKYTILFTIILIATTQVLFLVYGINFERIWEVTEYKELFISLVLFIYSWDVYAHINKKHLLGQSKMKIVHADDNGFKNVG